MDIQNNFGEIHNKNILELCIFRMDKVVNEISIDYTPKNVTTKELLNKMNKILNEERIRLNYENSSNGDSDIFALWMTSPLLEIQLNDLYRPFNLLENWDNLLENFAQIKHNEKNLKKIEEDRPILSFQRNIFLTKEEEQKVSDYLTLKLLYEEAKENVLDGRYPMNNEFIILAAYQIKIEIDHIIDDSLVTTDFIKPKLDFYLPKIYIQNNNISLLTLSKLRSPLEQKILEAYKNIPKNQSKIDLYKAYLKICRNKPFYGAAFFQGQIEKNVSNIGLLLNHFDIDIWVAINFDGIHIIDKKKLELLLSFDFFEFKWEAAYPKSIKNKNSLPCLFLQINQNGKDNEFKLLQIFSRQSQLMHTTLKTIKNLLKTKIDNLDGTKSICSNHSDQFINSLKPKECIQNLKKVCCATYDTKGNCIKKQGSFKCIKSKT